MKKPQIKFNLLLLTALFAAALYFFYLRYVPMVPAFQFMLAPILLLVFILTLLNLRWGLFFFILTMPLVNNMPFFYGIPMKTPQAPVALVVFLFFFLGWLAHITFFKTDLSFDFSILKPMVLLSLIICVSGLITFFRYANFYPFLSDSVYELSTNVKGITAGGAIMSTVFFSLNYLSGFVLFFIVVNTVRSKDLIKKTILVLLVSTSIAVLFGLYQNLKDITFGNSPFWIKDNYITSTFKDPLSLGAFLAMIAPLILGSILFFRKAAKPFLILLFLSVLYILPHSGSKSGYIAFVFAVSLFIVLWAVVFLKGSKKNLKKPKIIISAAVAAALIIIFLLLSKESKVFHRFNYVKSLVEAGDIGSVLSSRLEYRWRMAVYMIEDYPLTGVGMGGFLIESSNYAEMKGYPHQKMSSESAENYFFQVASELGLFGLVLTLWIFGEIARKIWTTLGKGLYVDRWKYIQIGLVCGIIAQFLIFLVHTYIGSYEIKYTFWLLGGLLFVLGSDPEPSERQKNFSNRFLIISAVLILSFGVIHLWNSTHSLSLRSHTEQLGMIQEFGLYPQEKTADGREYNWTKINAGKTVKIEKPFLELTLHASHPDIRDNPVSVKIYVVQDLFKRKKLLQDIMIQDKNWRTYRFSVSEEVGEEVLLLFKINRTWNPLKTIGTRDPRNLGIALGEIRFSD